MAVDLLRVSVFTYRARGDANRIPGFPAYSLIMGLLIASILISFKRRMVRPTHR